jgi:hypothetical protein
LRARSIAARLAIIARQWKNIWKASDSRPGAHNGGGREGEGDETDDDLEAEENREKINQVHGAFAGCHSPLTQRVDLQRVHGLDGGKHNQHTYEAQEVLGVALLSESCRGGVKKTV